MDFEKITELIVELELDDIANAIKEAIEEDEKEPLEVLNALRVGMDEVGRRYEEEIYYLADLMLAAEVMKKGVNELKPHLVATDEDKKKAKVIIATVKGDNHDIGKNLLGTLLLSSGFDVIDLGKDVDPGTIVEKVKETGAKVIGLSTLLSMTVPQIQEVHEALEKAGLRKEVRLIVGGAPLNMETAMEFGADDFAEDSIKGVEHIKHLTNA
ncbi:MAG: cobalamin-binding protein [Candidatus Lokiarchaeota archaeon]|nr:cobalamin-binding protein [Candidatus Lokiarchaeota archaeon]MBD3341685.1 cobalamin-binding protein [Candidatus Lokiarchaeota archaeon]